MKQKITIGPEDENGERIVRTELGKEELPSGAQLTIIVGADVEFDPISYGVEEVSAEAEVLRVKIDDGEAYTVREKDVRP